MIPHVHLSLGRSVCLSKSFTSMLLSEHLFSSLMAFKSKYQKFDIFVFSWSVTVRKMLSDSQSMIISWTQFYPFPCNGSFPNLFQLPFSPPHALHSPFFLVRRGAFLHFVHPRILGHFYFIFWRRSNSESNPLISCLYESLLQVQLPYETSCLTVVGWLVRQSVCHNLLKLTFLLILFINLINFNEIFQMWSTHLY